VEKLRPLVESFELRQRLGEDGRAYVERVHDLDKVADRLIEIYRSVLDK
jgi:glycosyltransferase involved in cell wall biosynthesis